MSAKKPEQLVIGGLWRLFVSVKFTVVLLLLWLLLSVAGTLIPQDAPANRIVETYGPEMADFLETVGLFDVYHSTGYTLVLWLLILALVACSLNTLAGKIVLAFRQPQSRRIEGTGPKYVHIELPVSDSETALEKFSAILSKTYKVDRFQTDGNKHLYAQRQPWAHFMVYVVHLSLVVIMAGGMIGALFGFDGIMEVQEGGQSDVAFLRGEDTHKRAKLGFSVRCDHFELQRFSDGRPKAYISDLAIVENGQEMQRNRIEVNTPMSYGRFSFYQSSYVELAPIIVTDMETGKSSKLRLREGDMGMLDELQLALRLNDFRPGAPGGMAADVDVLSPNGQSASAILRGGSPTEISEPDFPKLNVAFDGARPAYVTGLMVVSDPGVILVWVGCFLMVAGLYLTFYSSHRRISIIAEKNSLRIHGLAQRNMPAFRREIANYLRQAGMSTEESKTS